MGAFTKICGVKTPQDIAAAAKAGARYVGFVFYEKSPRHISLDTARALAAHVPKSLKKVALFVDAPIDAIAAVIEALHPDWLQFHGSESPAQVAALRAQFNLPVLKAIGVSAACDLQRANHYRDSADKIIFDAKPPHVGALPGGNGQAFDWNMMRSIGKLDLPWMLGGGLNIANVGEAITTSAAKEVDVSSGVEDSAGNKSPAKIANFVRAALEA